MVEMKKVWTRPLTIVQNFEANEYVAACGDGGTVYYFECNAGEKGHKYAVKNAQGFPAYISGNLMDGYLLNYYSPCRETHEAESNSGFLTGYHIDDTSTIGDEKIDVIIWTNNDTNVHCTTKLNMSEWETAKS